MTEITIKFDNIPTPADVSARLRMLAKVWEGAPLKEAAKDDTEDTDTTEVKPKKAVATKTKKQAKPVDDDETFDLDSTDTEDETADSFDDDDTEDEIDQSTIIQAFQKYSKKHSREKAAAALAKFKVKSVLALKASDYPAVLKLLGK